MQGAGAVFPYKLLFVPKQDLCGNSTLCGEGITTCEAGLMCDQGLNLMNEALVAIANAGDEYSEVKETPLYNGETKRAGVMLWCFLICVTYPSFLFFIPSFASSIFFKVSQYTGITQLDGKTLTFADYEAAFTAVEGGNPSSEQESMVLLYEGFCQALTEGTTQTLCASAYDSVVIAKNPFSAKGTKVFIVT
jgi:hypothetical protein